MFSGGTVFPQDLFFRYHFCQGTFFAGSCRVASENMGDSAMASSERDDLRRERLIRVWLCQDRWRWERLLVAELSEQSKYVEHIPHVDKL